ncbi:MAG: polymer-forming cytoskeletal protein [Leptospiraceae bacterium]|nr:polymer-forming cytoskeletal protein [Leptospiraceae bacterium]MCB1315529.1 polymer-forming cytoskeletal protein [Leptospiraceae bacterium]MCB1322867.1 polymer-forming cytoskeletal protein [Leptospiraceae bacterium]
MAKKRESGLPEITEGGAVSTVLGRETSFEGVLEFSRPLQINGEFQGEIITDGVLLVGETARIKANIKAGTVVVGGHITGNIEALNRLEMLGTGKVVGNIKTAKLQIADGVVFDGNCEMIDPQN